jgi:hypothetical protein
VVRFGLPEDSFEVLYLLEDVGLLGVADVFTRFLLSL